MKSFLLLLLIMLVSCSDYLSETDKIVIDKPYPPKPWTIMVYLNGDNNLERNILENIAAMKRGMNKDRGFNLVVLIDRISGYSSDSTILGENFTGTRLYDVRFGKALQISGRSVFPELTGTDESELDLGSAEILKKFIRFAKQYYPADHNALIIGGHGSGIRDLENYHVARSVSNDDTSGTTISPADFTDVLTSQESIDLIGFDACFMSCVEMAYQLRTAEGRFSPGYMVASAPEEWVEGWNYETIIQRIDSDGGYNNESDETLGGYEELIPSSELSAVQLGNIIIEEFRDITDYSDPFVLKHSLSLIRLDRAADLKSKLDSLVCSIGQSFPEKVDCINFIDSLRTGSTRYYNGDPFRTLMYPYNDLYDICRIIKNQYPSTPLEAAAISVQTSLDECIVSSFAVSSSYPDFKSGASGLSIFIPDGDSTISSTLSQNNNVGISWINKTYWEFETWYHPYDELEGMNGRPEWCQSTSNDGINNWSELIYHCYDVSGSYIP